MSKQEFQEIKARYTDGQELDNEQIAEKMIGKALGGDVRAIIDIMDLVEGKP
jgi:hypothetical protein